MIVTLFTLLIHLLCKQMIDWGHMKFSGTHRKCIEYLTALVPLIAENLTVCEWTCYEI